MNKTLLFMACLLLFLSSAVFAQPPTEVQFKHLSVVDGLSASNVNCIFQDKEGFMWFGSVNGLNKFDGYTFTVYKSDPSDPFSIIGNIINDMIEDDSANLWIATSQGLSMYNRKQNTFTNYIHDKAIGNTISGSVAQCVVLDPDDNVWIGTESGLSKFDRKIKKFINYTHADQDPGTLANNDVTSIMKDQKGSMWIGTRGGGLDLFDPTSGNFIHHVNNLKFQPPHGNNNILDLYEDSYATIWVATEQGLFTYDKVENTFIHHIKDSEILYNVIVCIGEDGAGDIWIGTENDGLYIYHRRTQTFENLKNTGDPVSLSNNSIYSIYRDHQKNMWVGTYTGAINIFDAHRDKFIHYKNVLGDNNSLNNNSVVSLAPDGGNGIWIGTDGGGLNHFVKSENKFTHYVANARDKSSGILGNHVGGLLLDGEGNLWSTSWGEGVNILLKGTQKFEYYRNKYGDQTSLSSNYGFETYEDRQGDLWVGTMGAGLNRLNKDRQSFTRYIPATDSAPGISSKFIYAIFEDSYSNIWIGTEDFGLNLFNRNSNKFTHYSHQANNLRSLSNNTVNVVFQDKHGNLWVGTNSGLNKFNYSRKDFDVFMEKDGLPGGVVKSIESDSKGNLWLGTSSGISTFNLVDHSFKTYTVDDGLQGNEFNRQASLRTKDGELYFGGNNGLTSFFPDSIVENMFVAPVVITDFLIFNKPVPIGKGGSPLTDHINETKEITLSYNESVFSVGFAALDFIHPREVQYAYKLEGFDTGWNFVGNSRMATYTHMDPGDYTFCVKASNSNGNWGRQIKSLKIKIIPPFWATVWFRILVGAFITALILAFIRMRLYALRRQKKILEQKVIEKNISLQDLVRRQDKLLGEKGWLIKEIHHRVKNNLHMISGLLESQAGFLETGEAVTAIRDSQHRVNAMSLIHQKLYQSEDLSAINMPAYIHELVEYLKDSFDVKRRIHFDLQIERIELDVSYSIPIGLILNEAITNAIKYAFPGNGDGIVQVTFNHTGEDTFLLAVRDNGVGISEELDLVNHSSMGMNLMKGLSADIGGVFSMERNQGTLIHINFTYDPDISANVLSKSSG